MSENKQADMQKDLMSYERYRQQLMGLANQKQQLQMHNSIADAALKELEKTKEEKVYKAIGNILIYTDKKDVEAELKKEKEEVGLKLKTLETQEKTVTDLLNKLRIKIEGAMPKQEEKK